MSEVVLTPSGLYTAPNPYGSVPAGALRVAQNVVIRRPGIVEPRDSFSFSVASSTGGYTVKRLFAFATDLLMASSNGTLYEATWLGSGGTVTLPSGSNALRKNWGRAAESRGHLYLATTGRVLRFRRATDTAPAACFQPPIEMSCQIISGTIVPSGKQVAVRALVVRKLAADASVTPKLYAFSTFGPPSPRFIVNNDEVSAKGFEVVVAPLSGAAVGDLLQIFRSVITTGTPSDELFLAHEHTITAGDISSGVTIAITASDAQLGAPLYTSPSQEGFDLRNGYPPSCRDLALFRGSMFYANITRPHAIAIAHASEESASSGEPYVLQTGNATGLGSRLYTATMTSSSADLTALSSTVGLKVGMLINHANVPAGTHVTVIAGSTVTMSAAATGSATASVEFRDSVWIKRGGTTERYQQFGTSESIANKVNRDSSLVYALQAHDRTVQEVVFVTPAASQALLSIESRQVTDASFEVFATHGDEYTPVLDEPSAASTTVGLSVQSLAANQLFWSKADQPEHVPPLNFALVGDGSAILRIIPTRDVLWVFKTDGVFALTGYGALSGWQIESVDPGLKLLAPEAACALGGSVYGWTNRGFVRVSSAGVDEISALPIGSDLAAVEQKVAASDLEAATIGAWCCPNEKRGEVLFSVPTAASVGAPSTTYCFNERTGAITEWTINPTHAALSRSRLYMASQSADEVLIEADETLWPSASNPIGFDRFAQVTISSIVGSKITVASSAWSPAVGDAIWVIGGPIADFALITSVDSSTVFDVDLPGLLAVDLAYAFEPFTSTVEFHAKALGLPTSRKSWMAAELFWESQRGLSDFTLRFRSSASTATTSIARSRTRSDAALPAVSGTSVPRAHARSHVLYPGVVVSQPLARWQLAGVALHGSGQPPRGARRGA